MSVGADGPTRLRALTEAQAEAQADGQGNAPVAANDNNRVETDRSTAGIGSANRMLYAGGSPEASAGASVSDTIRRITTEELTALGLIDPANDNTPLTILDIQRDTTPARVYNLSIESLPGQLTHNYFVGDWAAWVHNARKGAMKYDARATGPHTTFKFGSDGKISGYQEWFPATDCRNHNLFEPGKRFRGTGRPHGKIDPPYINLGNRARKPKPEELPRGY